MKCFTIELSLWVIGLCSVTERVSDVVTRVTNL